MLISMVFIYRFIHGLCFIRRFLLLPVEWGAYYDFIGFTELTLAGLQKTY
jgi:hypothetical protein